jgi:hypothetical protein
MHSDFGRWDWIVLDCRCIHLILALHVSGVLISSTSWINLLEKDAL